MHAGSLDHERAGQLHGRGLQQRPAEGVEAPEPEPLVPQVDVGETQRPHGGDEKLRGDSSCELERYEDAGRPDAGGAATHALQSRGGVTRGLPESYQVDYCHGVGESQAGGELQLTRLAQKFEFVGAAAELEGGRRLQQVKPVSSREKTRCATDRLAEEHRNSQRRYGNPQVGHLPALHAPTDGLTSRYKLVLITGPTFRTYLSAQSLPQQRQRATSEAGKHGDLAFKIKVQTRIPVLIF